MLIYDHTTLRKLRESRGKTRRDVCQANLLDVSQQTLMSWETGNAAPRADYLAILATAYEVSVAEFFRKKP